MISVNEALSLVEQNSTSLPPRQIALANGLGKMVAAPIISPIDSPPFHQSAMDGYAFHFDSCMGLPAIPLFGISQTGNTEIKHLPPGMAMRVYTGAAVPQGADTVVIQERVLVKDEQIFLQENSLEKGSNVRLKGSQINKNELAVNAGHRLNPGLIGYLAGLGISHVPVFPDPKIGLLITGKELVPAGTNLAHGQIFESNSFMLETALQEGNLTCCFKKVVDDIEEDIFLAIKEGMELCDVLLITGGVSVGDYDFVNSALSLNKVQQVFYKVKQKPGKPLFFGTKAQKLVFGLPGNPASVLTCFYEYVVPCLRKMKGLPFHPYGKTQLPIAHSYKRKAGLTGFLKARVVNNFVYVNNNQESYKLNAFADTNCLLVLEESQAAMEEGDLATVHFLSHCWT